MTNGEEKPTTDDHHIVAEAATERYGVFDSFAAVDIGDTNAASDHDVEGVERGDRT